MGDFALIESTTDLNGVLWIAMILLDRSCHHDPSTKADESSGGPSH
jgi:hypothetical protein